MSVPSVLICADHITQDTMQGFLDSGSLPMRPVKLGRVKSDKKQEKLVQFGDFAEAVPPPPATKSWITPEAMKSIQQVYGNDQYGDCVIASAFHGIGTSSANDEGASIVGTTREAVSEYGRLCGHLGNDNGCIITEVKNAMISGGISIGGVRRLLDGYAAVDPSNKTAFQVGILIFGGGVNIGFNVPNSWMGRGTFNGAVWDWDPNNTDYQFVGGHDIRAVGYNDQGVQFATWGIIITMTWRALANSNIVDEAYVEVEKDWGAKSPIPSGFDVAGLKAALQSFNAGQVPGWAPAPVPPVPPSPVPPVPPTPSNDFPFVYSTGGTVFFPDGRTLVPFPDAPTIPVFLAQSPDGLVLAVGAGPGGGPRLATFSTLTLAMLTNEMVGDVNSRTGVALAPFGTPVGPNPTQELEDMLAFNLNTVQERGKLSPAQWAAIIKLILTILPIFFGSVPNAKAAVGGLSPAQWQQIIAAILALIQILFPPAPPAN